MCLMESNFEVTYYHINSLVSQIAVIMNQLPTSKIIKQMSHMIRVTKLYRLPPTLYKDSLSGGSPQTTRKVRDSRPFFLRKDTKLAQVFDALDEDVPVIQIN